MEEKNPLIETNESTVETVKHEETFRTEEEISNIKQQVIELKEEANADFKKGQFLSAINKYTICKIPLIIRHRPGRRY